MTSNVVKVESEDLDTTGYSGGQGEDECKRFSIVVASPLARSRKPRDRNDSPISLNKTKSNTLSYNKHPRKKEKAKHFNKTKQRA